MIQRLINPLKSNSFFLFGARGTGKTFFLKNFFSKEQYLLIDLLSTSNLARFSAYPEELSKIVKSQKVEWIVIDEVQKIPSLLDLVHKHIEEDRQKFVLTGSSARKLKRGGANLLAGRAYVNYMFPLTHRELAENFDLHTALAWGSLPKSYLLENDQEKRVFLNSYTDTYLKEEILIEQIVRKLPPFQRFLEIAAHTDTEEINLTNIAADVLTSPKNIQRYYQILEDTLLGFFLESYHTSIRKRQKRSKKFYWFDVGIIRSLTGSIDNKLLVKSYEYGKLFESFVINEIKRLLTYSGRRYALSFLRTTDGQEIDLIIERAGMPTYLVEIKSTDFVREEHVTTLNNYLKEFKNAKAICLSNDLSSKKIGAVDCFEWKEGITEMGI